jgi:hypothetical protein
MVITHDENYVGPSILGGSFFFGLTARYKGPYWQAEGKDADQIVFHGS